MNIFEQASRSKLRFDYKGNISTEDLWDLDTKKLNVLYKNIHPSSICKCLLYDLLLPQEFHPPVEKDQHMARI